MKTLIAFIAIALLSPGLYEIGKAVQVRRNADAQARYDAQQLRLADEKKRTDEQATAIGAAQEKAATDYRSRNPDMTWTYDNSTQRWVEHQRGVSVRQSRGGF